MCFITATELKNNLGYYLELASKEKVYITKNNKVITVMCDPHETAFYELESLLEKERPNMDKSDKSFDELFYEAMKEKHGITH